MTRLLLVIFIKNVEHLVLKVYEKGLWMRIINKIAMEWNRVLNLFLIMYSIINFVKSIEFCFHSELIKDIKHFTGVTMTRFSLYL